MRQLYISVKFRL